MYSRAIHLCKSVDNPTEMVSIFDALTENEFWDGLSMIRNVNA